MSDDAAVELHARIRWTIAAVEQLTLDASEPLSDAGVPASATTPMEVLADQLGLTRCELDALWLLACCEIEPRIAQALRSVAAPDVPDVSVAMLRRVIEVAAAEELDDGALARLEALRLVETVCDRMVPAYRRPIRPNDRVVSLARGRLGLDPEVAKFATLAPPDELAARGTELPEALSRAFDRRAVIAAKGVAGNGQSELLAHVAARRGQGTLRVRGADLSREAGPLARQLGAVVRECRLFDAIPLVEELDAALDDDRELFAVFERELFAQVTSAVLITTSAETVVPTRRTVVVHRVPTAGADVRARAWRGALPGVSAQVVEAAAAYALTPGAIARAADAVAARVARIADVTPDDVQEAVRAQLDQRLEGIATRIEPTQTWDDVVLPRDQFDQLIELAARVRQRRTVLEDWGFADKVGRGLGVAALFSGPPGTGKTMVAGLMAKELGLDLYQVDLSRVVSKYIGETEKQLAAVFDAAEVGHAIILFDEADALFAKRTEVKSSNDRYANLEVNYLLQRLEQFRGVAILTSNHESGIDEAFRRRLAVHVRFVAPDEAQRALLWKAMLPERAAVANDVDFARLAGEFVMSGGYIKNAVLRAAYIAADQGASIGMRHLLRGARAEYEAMGKIAA